MHEYAMSITAADVFILTALGRVLYRVGSMCVVGSALCVAHVTMLFFFLIIKFERSKVLFPLLVNVLFV